MDIRAYWRAVLDQDAAAMRSFLDPDAEIRWHCTNERFTAGEFIRANCEYPGEWEGEIERIEHTGNLYICAVHVFTKGGGISCHCISFIRTANERIAEIDEYWADDSPPPVWRQEMRIGRKILES